MDFHHRQITDNLFRKLFKTAGLLIIGILGSIFLLLMYNSIAFFLDFKPADFLTDSQWNPAHTGHAEYGILPLLVSTCLVTAGAMVLAIPLGIFTAAFLSEFAGKR